MASFTPALRKKQAKPRIAFGRPRPYLDPPGTYLATCVQATYEWQRRYKKWTAILVFEPEDYTRPSAGELCAFLNLGRKESTPYAGQSSHFYKLATAVNGAPLAGFDFDNLQKLFVGSWFEIEVVTIKRAKPQDPERPQEQWYSKIRRVSPLGKTASLGAHQQRQSTQPAGNGVAAAAPLPDGHDGTKPEKTATEEVFVDEDGNEIPFYPDEVPE